MSELLLDDGFYLSDGYSSDEECSEVPSYIGNDELHPQGLNTLSRGSSDECEDDEVMKILCLLCLQRMRINIRKLGSHKKRE